MQFFRRVSVGPLGGFLSSLGLRRLSLQKSIFLWLPALFWAGLIFYLSGRPGLKVAEGAADFFTRKLAHIGEYSILFLLLFRALRGSFSWSVRAILWGAGLFSFFYAVTDEVHQIFVPLREGRITDLFFDLLGIVAAFLIIRFDLLRKQPS